MPWKAWRVANGHPVGQSAALVAVATAFDPDCLTNVGGVQLKEGRSGKPTVRLVHMAFAVSKVYMPSVIPII